MQLFAEEDVKGQREEVKSQIAPRRYMEVALQIQQVNAASERASERRRRPTKYPRMAKEISLQFGFARTLISSIRGSARGKGKRLKYSCCEGGNTLEILPASEALSERAREGQTDRQTDRHNRLKNPNIRGLGTTAGTSTSRRGQEERRGEEGRGGERR